MPHHQIDVLDVTEEASVAAYQRHARADIEAVLARGRLPVVAGGSGLYVRAALDRLEIPPTDPEVRAAPAGAARPARASPPCSPSCAPPTRRPPTRSSRTTAAASCGRSR